jgi:hypothetical protein
MACQSTIPRLSGKDPGWTCTGEDLVVLMTNRIDGRDVPVVCPRDRLPEAMRDPWAERMYRPRPYLVAGDHLHLMLGPRHRPSRLCRLLRWWR